MADEKQTGTDQERNPKQVSSAFGSPESQDRQAANDLSASEDEHDRSNLPPETPINYRQRP
jgi:hypothetical protein